MLKNMNNEVPPWILLEQDNLKKSILLQEIFQWCGLAFSLIVVLVAPAIHQQVWNYALFMIPLNYFAVARADYMIHRNGGKARALENYVGYAGNEHLQKSTTSFIALFDIPAFVCVALLGKLFSPYALNDFSQVSMLYWVACAIAAFFVWLATNRAESHYLYYKNALSQYSANK